VSILDVIVAPRFQRAFWYGAAAGGVTGAGVAAWLLYSYTRGPYAGTPDAAEALGLLVMVFGFPLSMVALLGFAAHPLVGWSLIILSITVMWGCVGAAISTIGALLAAEITERGS
jgi:uncharacterized membrane protein